MYNGDNMYNGPIDNMFQKRNGNIVQQSFPFENVIFNTQTNHPLIPNSQEYIYYKKYVSIHSEDRNILKYPDSSEFEIELPEDMLNVVALRLVQWTFPSNYNTFSILNGNIAMTFKINNPYNPNENGVTDLLAQKVFEFLFLNQNNDYGIFIEQGFYNPQQMITELTNKFNNIVTILIAQYFKSKSIDPLLTPLQQQEYIDALSQFNLSGGYTNFVIVYNNVSQKIWFGNSSDGFTLTNETQISKNINADNFICATKSMNPDFSDWGLPGNLGLTRCNTSSVSSADLSNFTEIALYNGSVVPRFYYGDVFPGDNGFWLIPKPNLTGSIVHWVEADYKINLMGPAFIYMELEGQNCIDETQPYNISEFTIKTNQTNGIVDSAFAKMAVPTTPISQWFDRDSLPYKFYYPPAERMRRFKFKIRYHNGQPVNFGVFNYTFVIEFTIMLPQILRKQNAVPFPPPLGR
jgi:hypothetical protein